MAAATMVTMSQRAQQMQAEVEQGQRAWAQALMQGGMIVGGFRVPPGISPGQIYTWGSPWMTGQPATWQPGQPMWWLQQPVPRFQTGGIVTRPTLALLGEAGPEAVVPLQPATHMPVASQPPPVINVQVTYAPLYGAATPAERQAAARAIIRDLREELRRQGATL
jgi:hypothetical protein